MIEHMGRGMTNEACIQLAKRLAKKHLSLYIKKGRTARDLHPDVEVENRLRKRGLLTREIDDRERKELGWMYRHMDEDDLDDMVEERKAKGRRLEIEIF